MPCRPDIGILVIIVFRFVFFPFFLVHFPSVGCRKFLQSLLKYCITTMVAQGWVGDGKHLVLIRKFLAFVFNCSIFSFRFSKICFCLQGKTIFQMKRFVLVLVFIGVGGWSVDLFYLFRGKHMPTISQVFFFFMAWSNVFLSLPCTCLPLFLIALQLAWVFL